jgi:hypothetical protein
MRFLSDSTRHHKALRLFVLAGILVSAAGCAPTVGANDSSSGQLAQSVEALNKAPVAQPQQDSKPLLPAQQPATPEKQTQPSVQAPSIAAQQPVSQAGTTEPPVYRWTKHDPNDTF